ncbi:hypothetical protein LIER_35572 [Lithospermum erythrorhizon]|uniref:Uncharacterized protein n=1 Tax=Lithospermum erythrorhizon TaxID=34254 RepID=A0AAV3NUG4_LITER
MGNKRGGKSHPRPYPLFQSPRRYPKFQPKTRPAEIVTLPLVANETSIENMLRECADANPILFDRKLYADADEDVMVQFTAPDDSNHHGDKSASETSSSEDNEPTTDPSVISASDSANNHVSRFNNPFRTNITVIVY